MLSDPSLRYRLYVSKMKEDRREHWNKSHRHVAVTEVVVVIERVENLLAVSTLILV